MRYHFEDFLCLMSANQPHLSQGCEQVEGLLGVQVSNKDSDLRNGQQEVDDGPELGSGRDRSNAALREHFSSVYLNGGAEVSLDLSSTVGNPVSYLNQLETKPKESNSMALDLIPAQKANKITSAPGILAGISSAVMWVSKYSEKITWVWPSFKKSQDPQPQAGFETDTQFSNLPKTLLSSNLSSQSTAASENDDSSNCVKSPLLETDTADFKVETITEIAGFYVYVHQEPNRVQLLAAKVGKMPCPLETNQVPNERFSQDVTRYCRPNQRIASVQSLPPTAAGRPYFSISVKTRDTEGNGRVQLLILRPDLTEGNRDVWLRLVQKGNRTVLKQKAVEKD